MKIGVMTFWWSEDNYGQQLQVYALQRYLTELGHDVFLIRYDPRKDYIVDKTYFRYFKVFNPNKLWSYLTLITKKMMNNVVNKNHSRSFSEFRAINMKLSVKLYTSLEELRADPPEAQMYICGSDQIWNYPDIYSSYENVISAFFLDFGSPQIKRVSYAASFGRDNLGTSLLKHLSPLLEKFDYISVRESSGVDICKKLNRYDAQWLLDPTMLLAADSYRFLFADRYTSKKYIFLYILGNNCDIPIRQIKKDSKNSQIEIMYTASQFHFDLMSKIYPTLPEWLSLIANAEYIVTNSYHGMIFCILFKKNFIIIPLKGKLYKEMNTRIFSLLKRLNIFGKIFDGNFYKVLNTKVDWETVTEKIRHDASFDFLNY